MKIVLLIALAFATGCNSQKPLVASSAKLEQNDCPPKGNCTIELLKDKTLIVKTDDFGSLFYKIEDNPGTSVIKYQFSKGDEEKVPDSGYREEILFELAAESPAMDVSGLALQNTKMLFGRFCFCQQTGYYRVTEGRLIVTPREDEIKIALEFTVPEIPQITKKINAILK